MRIKGKSPDRPKPEICVIPRTGGDDIVFQARLISYDRFKDIYPTPKPPSVVKAGGQKFDDYADGEYLESMNKYTQARVNFMIIESLAETDGLEWETVKPDDPSTWGNYEQELLDAGFNQMEINHIIAAVMNANSMNESRFEEAKNRFLRIQEEADSPK